MKCFVIMPFEQSFDDVYVIIKAAVEGAISEKQISCYRLDETRPAGRITDRLLTELDRTDLCVADLTGNKPNVMWEVGYAMALQKPIIIVTQRLSEIPFDLKDMQAFEYEREHLGQTLSGSLKEALRDTLEARQCCGSTTMRNGKDSLIVEVREVSALRNELSELREMVSQLVKSWTPPVSPPAEGAKIDTGQDLVSLEGSWVNRRSRTNHYAKLVHGKLWVPYCYGGNDHLTACYYDWVKTGDYWFARFKWIDGSNSGFTFLKFESIDELKGEWWHDELGNLVPEIPALGSGVRTRWERVKMRSMPSWAINFFEEIRLKGAFPISVFLGGKNGR